MWITDQFVVSSVLAVLVMIVHTNLGSAQLKNIEATLEVADNDNLTMSADHVISVCSKFLENGSGDKLAIAKARRIRGKAYWKLGKPDLARLDFEELCKLRPDDSESHVLLAMSLTTLSQFEGAEARIDNALRLNQRYAAAHWVRAEINSRKGERELAIRNATIAIKLNEKLADAYYLRGSIYYTMYDVRRCIEDMNKIIEMEPTEFFFRNGSNAYLLRGACFLNLTRPSEALSNFLAARKNDPESFASAWGLSQAYMSLGRFHLAAYWSEVCIRADSKFVNAYLHLARAKIRTGAKREEIDKLVAQIRAMQNSNPSSIARLGTVYAELGNYELAASLYSEALKQDPDCGHAICGKVSLLSTCPDQRYRDGKVALELISELYEQKRGPDWNRWFLSIHMAEAHGECGDFRAALKFTNEAIGMVERDFEPRKEFEEMKSTFENKMAYRRKPLK